MILRAVKPPAAVGTGSLVAGRRILQLALQNGFVVSFVVPPWENASPFSKILRDKGKKS
jgi:hypothetical protein